MSMNDFWDKEIIKARADMESFRRKYEALIEVAPVVKAITAVLAKPPKTVAKQRAANKRHDQHAAL